MEQLVDDLFSSTSSYQARVVLKRQEERSKRPLVAGRDQVVNDYFFPPLNDNQHLILSFLPPQDILAWWRCCTATWKSLSVEHRRKVMLRSVFTYLRISERSRPIRPTEMCRRLANVLVLSGQGLRVHGQPDLW